MKIIIRKRGEENRAKESKEFAGKAQIPKVLRGRLITLCSKVYYNKNKPTLNSEMCRIFMSYAKWRLKFIVNIELKFSEGVLTKRKYPVYNKEQTPVAGAL